MSRDLIEITYKKTLGSTSEVYLSIKATTEDKALDLFNTVREDLEIV